MSKKLSKLFKKESAKAMKELDKHSNLHEFTDTIEESFFKDMFLLLNARYAVAAKLSLNGSDEIDDNFFAPEHTAYLIGYAYGEFFNALVKTIPEAHRYHISEDEVDENGKPIVLDVVEDLIDFAGQSIIEGFNEAFNPTLEDSLPLTTDDNTTNALANLDITTATKQ